MKKIWNKAKKAVVGVFATATMAMTMAMPAFADGYVVNQNATTGGVVGGIISTIFELLMYLGVILGIIGIGQFLYAYKDQNGEAQGNALRLALIGLALVGLPAIILATGLITKAG